ncbi:polyprenyl diphosphate synthase [Streptosporangium algeriense]|uniref:Isoprenyl transferase n=1 Tax=Streptosporangium algeriense TaxID=1682748 RepID=A0ABW3DHE2_9ACTN
MAAIQQLTNVDGRSVRGREVAPDHLAVIMDGNRRWAELHALPVTEGYRLGAVRFGELLEWCWEARIEVVTAWALSTANLARPPATVSELLNVIVDGLQELSRDRRWCLRPIGCLDLLPDPIAIRLSEIAQSTLEGRGLIANVAIAYDGREEITSAVRSLVRERACAGDHMLDLAERITAGDIGERLYTCGQPEPDLVIRTSGEQRLSGFMPWQTADAELYFSPVAWPDFTRERFAAALEAYAKRKRRHGL